MPVARGFVRHGTTRCFHDVDRRHTIIPPIYQELQGALMTPEEALMTILRLIDGSEEVNDERLLQVLLKSIKTLAEKGLGRELT
jgi:hypothetical protein